MTLIPTKIAGVTRMQLELKGDSRGYFTRLFDLSEIRTVCPEYQIVQINRSLTQKKGTLRGIHFQQAPNAEDKLVQVLQGAIFDVAVDLRRDSPTYRQWVGVELSAENKELLLVPKGCGHAFQTLTDDCLVEYFVSQYYAPQSEGGIKWSDPAIRVQWPLSDPFTSDKDNAWPPFTP